MKALLISSPYAQSYGKMESPVQVHLGLAYLASSVGEDKTNHVDIIDMTAERLSAGAVRDIVIKNSYDVVGFTVTTPTFNSSIKVAQEVKRYSPGTTVIFGGIHPTIKPYETINADCVDIVVQGEGEIAFKEIIDHLRDKKDLSDIHGILYKKNGKIYKTQPRPPLEDLDSLPFPAINLFKVKRYTYPDALYKNTVPIFTSRGCPGKCTYCNTRQVFKDRFRARSARNVVDEIEFLVKKMDAKEIHIWDDNFTTVKKRVFEIRDEILKRNIKVKFAFPNGIRADFLSEEVMNALKCMGTYSIAVGAESGSQEVLDKARKGVTLDRVEEVFRLAKKIKLETWAFFIIGLPGETVDTIKETIRFAKKIDPDIAKFHILKPFPGTEVYDYLRSKGFILTENYDRFGIHTPPVHRLESLDPALMLMWQKKAYRDFYLRPIKIFRQVLRIKTLNRLFLNVNTGTGLLKLILSKDKEGN